MKPSDLSRWLDEHEIAIVRIDGTGIDGPLMGKHVSRAKFESCVPAGVNLANLHLACFRGVDNAEEIRDLVRDRSRHGRQAGLGDPDDTAEDGSRRPDGAVLAAALEALRRDSAAVREAARRLLA